VASLVGATTLLVTVGQDLLPRLVEEATHFSRTWTISAASASLCGALACVLLWFRRSSVLDLWLMVVTFSLFLELVLASGTAGRFSVEWYATRILGLLSANAVLIVLLYEITTLYAQLLRALLAQRRERTARLLTGDAVSASIAHEVRQPLAAMTTNAGAGLRWLARTTPNLDEARAALQRIVDDGHRAGAVLENIRALFKKDLGTRASLDIGELVHGTLGLARAELQASRVLVDVSMDERLPRIVGDHTQLQQVLLNLITNAIDSMAFISDRERLLRIACSRHPTGDVLISVEDSGVGVDPQNIGRVFDPLFTTKSGGMGMGLAICRSIIEAHQGRLWVLPDKGEGAAFQLVLPAETS
jgi:C4-dicarboxylate-specific signal transduction histidine kinase